MAEDLRKYTTSVKKTIDVLNQTTTSIESKIKELVLVLESANKGLLGSETKVRSALEGVAAGKFESKTKLEGYLKTLQLTDENVQKIVDRWVDLQSITLDTLKNSDEYGKMQRELQLQLEDELDLKQEIKKEDTEQLDQFEKKIDLVSDLSKQYKLFQDSIKSGGKQLKDINIDLTKGVTITKNFFNLADKIIPNLFSPEMFNSDSLQKQSNDLMAIKKSMDVGKSSIQMPGQEESIQMDVAISGLTDMTNNLKNSIDQEFELRKKKLQQYVAMSMGFQKDMETGALRDIQTQNEILGTTANVVNFAIEDRIKLYDDISISLNKNNNLSKDELKILNQKTQLLTAEEKLLLGQYASSKVILDKNKEYLNITSDQLNLYKKISSITSKYEDQINQIGVSFQETMNIIPYSLQRLLGISSMGQNLSDAMSSGLKSYSLALAEGENKLIASAKAAKAFGGSFTSILGPIGIVAIAIGTIVALVKGLEDKISNITKEMGVSRNVAKQITTDTLNIVSASSNRLATEEQILAIQKSQIEKNGMILDLSKKTNQDIVQSAILAEQAFGIVSTDAMDIISLFKQLGADDTLAQSLLADIGHMSELANISPNVIAKDMLDSSKEISLYFAGLPKQAAKAAIQIRRMGMSLKQSGQIADKMLNIEGFMTDMTELAAMSGGKLNLSEAFDLRMQGDIEGMTKSIMNNIGSLQDFNSQSEFVQRKLANTLGMEVADLRKSVKLKEMQNELSSDQTKILQANLDKIGDIENMSIQNMKSKAEELNSTQRLSVAFGKIKAILFKALVPIIETFSETLSSSTGIIDAIGSGFKLIGSVIKILSPVVKGFLYPFQLVGNLITKIVESLDSLFGSSKQADSSIAGMNSSLSSTTKIIETIGMAIGGFFGAKYISKLFGLNKIFGGVFDTVKTTVLSKTENIADGVSKSISNPSIFKGISEKFKSFNIFGGLKKQATDIDIVKPIISNAEKSKSKLGSIMDKINPFKTKNASNNTVLTESITNASQIDNKTSGIFDKISSITTKAVDIVKSSLGTLKDLIINIADTVSQVLIKLGSGIGSFFESTLGGIGNGLSKFQPKALIGAAALGLVAGALWVTSKALQNFNDVNWDSLGKAGIALAGLGVIAAGFGTFAGLITIGAIAISAAAGGLWLFGKALTSIGDIVLKIEPILSSLMNGIAKITGTMLSGINELLTTISNIDISQLLLLGPALMGIGAGLAVIAGGSIIQGITSLFASDPFSKLEDIAILASPLQIVSSSIKILTDHLSQLAGILNSIDLSKLELIGNNSIGINKSFELNATNSSSHNNISQLDANLTTPNIPSMDQSYNSIETLQSIEKTKNSNSPTINTNKMERLMTELLHAFVEYADRPAIAVLGEQAARDLNNKMKGMNNR